VKKWHLEDSVGQERCTRQLAQIAARKQKFLSNPSKVDLFIAGIVTKNIENTEVLN